VPGVKSAWQDAGVASGRGIRDHMSVALSGFGSNKGKRISGSCFMGGAESRARSGGPNNETL